MKKAKETNVSKDEPIKKSIVIKKTKESIKKAVKNAIPKKGVKKATPKEPIQKILIAQTEDIYKTPDIRVPTIVKIKVGRKYFIAKTHNIGWLLDKELPNQVKKISKGTYNTDNIYYPLVQYIFTNPKKRVSYEILFTSNSGYFTIKYEYELLNNSVGLKSCLNTSKQPHIPKTRATKEKLNDNTWFTESDRANYLKLLKKKRN